MNPMWGSTQVYGWCSKGSKLILEPVRGGVDRLVNRVNPMWGPTQVYGWCSKGWKLILEPVRGGVDRLVK